MKACPVILAVGFGIALYGLLLIVAGPVILLCVAVICFVWCIAWLCRCERRPLTDVDRQCARDDQELIRREAEARRAAMAGARSLQSGGGFRA